MINIIICVPEVSSDVAVPLFVDRGIDMPDIGPGADVVEAVFAVNAFTENIKVNIQVAKVLVFNRARE